MTFRLRMLLLVAVLLLAGGGVVALRVSMEGGSAAPNAAPPVDREAVAPEGVRVRVEVLNASGLRGLARRATMHLRDHGYDVVGIGNAPERRDSTLVVLRAGDEEWARRIARAMRDAAMEVRLDSSRHLDVTVLVGRDWRPPPGPLRP